MELKMKQFKTFLMVTFAIISFSSCTEHDKPLYRIQENGLFGFIDSIGNVIIKPQYKYVGHFNSEGYATVITNYCYKVIEKNDDLKTDTTIYIKYGFIDRNNNLVVDTTNVIQFSIFDAQNNGINTSRNIIMDFVNNNIPMTANIYDAKIKLKSNVYPIQNQNSHKMGYMNLSRDTIIPAIYESCSPFYNGVACVKKEYKISDISNTENFKIENLINDINNKLNSIIIIDSLGKEIISDGYSHIWDFRVGKYSWGLKKELQSDGSIVSTWFLFSNDGHIYSDSIYGENITIYNNNDKSYIWECNMKIGNVHIGRFYSFINENGNFLTDFNSDKEISFDNETFRDVTQLINGIVGVKIQYDQTVAWAFANEKFEFQSQPFDSLFQFSEGLAAVKEFSKNKNSKWGFVNKKYEIVIPYKFDEVSPFHNGLAYFRISNIEGYINKNGEVVWKTNRK